MKRYAAMWSGGKDGALALTRARAAGLEVDLLLNFHDAESGRVRFHATTAAKIAEQAAATGLRLRQVGTAWTDFEAALQTELLALVAAGYSGLVLGDIHLADVRAWYESRVTAAGLEHVEPIWGDPPADLVHEFVAGGGRAVITCCDLSRLDESFLGRTINADFLDAIRAAGVDPCGENGEYHSFTFAGPAFQRPVTWSAGERRAEGRFLQMDVV